MPTRRIAIYGNTLALAGIALALERQPHWSLVSLQVDDLTLTQSLEKYSPDVILFDTSVTDAQTILACSEQCRNLLAIGIEANSNRMVLWSGRSARALTIEDLAQVIDGVSESTFTPPPSGSVFDRVRQWHLHLSHRQKFIVALVTVLLCVGIVLGFVLGADSPNLNSSLAGAAVANASMLEIHLAFGMGLVLGGLLIGLWFYLRQRTLKK